MEAIIAQVFGFIGLICTIISVQQNKKNMVLIFQILANLMYFLQYFLLDAIAGAVVTLLGTIRCYIFFQYDKRQKDKSFVILAIFIILSVVLGMYAYVDIFSIIAIVNAVMYTYGVWQNNLKKFRVIAVIVPILWLIYNFHIGAYIGMISTLIEATFGIGAIVRLDILKEKTILEER